MSQEMLTEARIRKILSVVDAGLICGMGVPRPGKMCVEAAVCYALGEPHSDSPSCVGPVVRNFKTNLNDCTWPDSAARAAGLREIAIAQLGSDSIDQEEFARLMLKEIAKEMVPDILREASSLAPAHAEILNQLADGFETEQPDAMKNALAWAHGVISDNSILDESYRIFLVTRHSAQTIFRLREERLVAASSRVVANPSTASDDHEKLKKLAGIGVKVLTQMGSPGTKWLYLVEETAPN